jgi:PAS domain S-box-containing protein
LLVVVGIVSHFQMLQLTEADRWVVQTHEVREVIEAIRAQERDAEAGQRGYLLTDDPACLLPYHRFVHNHGAALDHLRQLTTDDPDQQQRLNTLQTLMARRLEFLQEIIDLHQTKGAAAAQERFRADLGQRVVDEIEQLTRQMQSAEEAQFRRRADRFQKRAWYSNVALATALLTALALVTLGLFLLNHTTIQRKAAQEDLRRAHAELENRVGERTTELSQSNAALQAEIAHRQRSEEKMEQLADIVESSEDAIIASSLEGVITSWNAGAERLYGYRAGEVIGKSATFLFPSDCPDELRSIMNQVGQGQHVAPFETIRLHKDGRRLDVSVSVSPIRDAAGQTVGASVIARDIRDRKRLEQQFLQAQKMEAVGRLAGGVAHDFNNLLTVILGYSELLLDHVRPSDPHFDILREVQRAGERAAELTRQLLAFSRKQVLQPRVIDLNRVVTEVDRILRRLIGEDIDLASSLGTSLYPVRVDPGQIEQVLMNLAVNARDAMPHGGKLMIETANIELDETYTRDRPEVRPGPYVMLAVSDTGSGMDAETKARLFEPFFSTKGPGKGTGLGLATVYGIVKQSGGFIYVYSEPGHGTVFKIYLPRVEERVDSLVRRAASTEAPGGTETVLLAEDQEGVRTLARQVLESRGYRVLEARSGQEALELGRKYADSLALLVTDVIMPRMSGRQLADQLTALCTQLRVLYLSGYTDDAIVHHGVLDPSMAFLQKPFTPGALARKVREVLDR